MAVRWIAVSGPEAENLLPILHDAEEDDDRIRSALRDPACRTYAALIGDEPVGAAVVRWAAPAEILYIAVAAGDRDHFTGEVDDVARAHRMGVEPGGPAAMCAADRPARGPVVRSGSTAPAQPPGSAVPRAHLLGKCGR